MHNLPLAFDIAIALEQAGVSSGGAETLENVRSDDQIYHAGFVFQRDKDDAGCGARSLPNQDKPGHFHPSAMRSLLNLRGGENALLVQRGPDELERILFERKARCCIVGHHFLAERNWGKRRRDGETERRSGEERGWLVF